MENFFKNIYLLLAIITSLSILVVVVGINYMRNYKEHTEEPRFVCGVVDEEYYRDESFAIQAGLTRNRTGELLFKENCTTCHNIKQVKVGPPLKNIQKLHSRKWLHKFIRNSDKLRESKDKKAIKIYKEYGGMQMPEHEFLTEQQIDSILAFIEFESFVIIRD